MTSRFLRSTKVAWGFAGLLGACVGSRYHAPPGAGEDAGDRIADAKAPGGKDSAAARTDAASGAGTASASDGGETRGETNDETRKDASTSPEDASLALDTAAGSDARPPAGKLVIYVGTADGNLTPYDVDTATGSITPKARPTSGKNPWFLKVWKGRRLYAALDGEATLVAYAIDQKTGALAAIGRAAGGGNVPVAIDLDDDATFAVTGDYGGTTTLFPLMPSGAPMRGTPTASGGNTHDVGIAHNRFVFSGSMAGKRVNQYVWDAAGKKLNPVGTAPGSEGTCAARGMTVHPNGKVVLVMCHTPITLMTYLVDPAKGTLTVADSGRPAVPAGANTASASGAEVQLHPNGTIAYATVVGGQQNLVTVFKVDPATGALQVLEHTKAGGNSPRGIAVDPEGRFVFSANQFSDSLTVFDVSDDGKLKLKKTIDLKAQSPGASTQPVGLAAVRLPL